VQESLAPVSKFKEINDGIVKPVTFFHYCGYTGHYRYYYCQHHWLFFI
jgi:hypothetical protein